MKLKISELCSGCCPENVTLGTPDAELAAHIKAKTLKKIDAQPARRHVRVRTLLLAAVIAAFFGSAAYAIARYSMNLQDVRDQDEVVSGHITEINKNGEVVNDETLYFPDAGLLLTFTGPDESYNSPEFKANWLPSAATHRVYRGEWTHYLCNDGKGNIMPYLITAKNVDTGNDKGVLNGKTEIVKQENWDGWEITEIVSDYTESSFANWEIVNYIFMFDPERGYLVRVSGTDSMETLEKIAENLEIRESDTPPFESPFSEEIGILDLGRG